MNINEFLYETKGFLKKQTRRVANLITFYYITVATAV